RNFQRVAALGFRNEWQSSSSTACITLAPKIRAPPIGAFSTGDRPALRVGVSPGRYTNLQSFWPRTQGESFSLTVARPASYGPQRNDRQCKSIIDPHSQLSLSYQLCGAPIII